MRFRILAEDRKEIRAKLEELSGERAAYTRMPRCAFILRGIAVEKNGEVTTEEDPDMELIGKLIESGLISGEIREEETVTAGEAENAGTGISEETGQEPDEQMAEREDGAEDHGVEDHGDQEVKPSISFPMDAHRPESIINLVNTMYAKGSLISKATGGEFGATKELAEELREGRFIRTEDVAAMIREDGGLKGLSFGDGKVTFDGFPETSDPEVVRGIAKFASSLPGVKDLHLLPYHDLGSNKYAMMGKDYELFGVQTPEADYMEYLKEIVEYEGLNCKIGG